MIRRLTAIGASFPIALSGQTLDAARFKNPPPDVRPARLSSSTDAPPDSAWFVADLEAAGTPEQLRARIGAALTGPSGTIRIALRSDPKDPLAAFSEDLAVWIARVTELARGRSDARMALLVTRRDSALDDFVDRLEQVQAIFDLLPVEDLEKSVVGPGELQVNGQSYHAIIVPKGSSLSRTAVARLANLARGGGTLIAFRPLLEPRTAWPDTGARFHALDSLPQLRDALMHTPWSGVRDPGPPALRIRALSRGEDHVFLLYNASDRRIPVAPTFRIIGQPELWDPDDGSIQFAPTRWSPRLAMTDVPIELDPFQLIGIVFKGNSNSPRGPIGAPPVERTVAQLASWTAADSSSSSTAEYEGTLALATVQAGAHYVLDLGEVHDVAEVELNGNALGRRLWRPYRFDVTKLIQQGTNRVTVRVLGRRASRLSGPVRLLLIR